MEDVIFLELHRGLIAIFDWPFPFSSLTNRSTGKTYGSLNKALTSGDFDNRVPAYLLDSGSRPGPDNSWCNFRCSGCFRPLQASRWYLYSGSDVSRSIRAPQNSLGNFTGSRGTEMDDANLRPYRPDASPLPPELSDGICYHQDRGLRLACDALYELYGIDPSRFF